MSDERAKFEVWASSQNWIIDRDSFGDYRHSTARDGWDAWQARAELVGAAEPVAWEVRRLDPDEGPSIWLPAHSSDLDTFRQRPHLWELRPLFAAPQPSPEQAAQSERLHTFLNAAAGEGFVLAGVDAADLYVEQFPERYAAAIAGITTPTEAK